VSIGKAAVLGDERPTIRLYGPGPASGGRHRGDKTIASWLQSRVEIGDVMYDVSAGAGAYAVFAARHRGATVVAFEPGFAAFKEMCDHLLLNGCDGSVVPIPLALADFEGLGALKFSRGLPGQHHHVVRRESWHERRPSGEGRALVQSACVTSLDAAISRYALPLPNHILLADPESAGSILGGAQQTLASVALQTIFATVPEDERGALVHLVAPFGWRVDTSTSISRGRAHIVFAKTKGA
jgi:FkbM family methyltransferase